MKKTLLLLHLVLIAPFAFACDETCMRDKVMAEHDVKFPAYLDSKYCKTTSVDFLVNSRKSLQKYKDSHVKQKVQGNPLFGLPQRLWARICSLADIPEEKVWGETSQKSLNKLLENLSRLPLRIKGKTTFKEEFVTCGGVGLDEVNFKTMESRRCPGLYMDGEILDIDGLTGGYNFQSAWTTGWLAGQAMGQTNT